MNLNAATVVLSRVKYPGLTFHLVGDFTEGAATFLQARWSAPTNWQANAESTEQSSREWLLSHHMTESELVQTALKCVLTAVEHEAREFFTYCDQPIFQPHYNVHALLELCEQGRLDVRVPPQVAEQQADLYSGRA